VSGSRVLAEGCRFLYGIDPGVFLRQDAPAALFEKAAELRKDGWWEGLCKAWDRCHIVKQLCFSCLRKESRPYPDHWDDPRLGYLAYIDLGVQGDYAYPSPDFDTSHFNFYDRLRQFFGEVNTLDDYLQALDADIDSWRSWGVVGMKTARAYTSGLLVSDPSVQEARTAFARKRDMTEADFRVVHDYAFRHALLACKRNGLPVVIHTGFQIWGHANLSQANPLLLHNLLIDPRYKDLTFVLLHGGNPYIGETAYLAGMFPNVIIDFTWISWMTPPRFRLALSEWLAIVPHTRFCWGSDSGTPETIAGTDRITRGLIADVLEAAIRDQLIDERYALEFIENTYLKTPRRVFGELSR